jgi:hypothetical protein
MKTSRRARIRDYVLYVGIGSAIFLSIYCLAVYEPNASHGLLAKWGGLALETTIVGSVLFEGERRSVVTILLWLALHFILWVPLLVALEDFRPFWWGAACIAEYFAFSSLLDHSTFRPFTKRTPRPRKGSPSS